MATDQLIDLDELKLIRDVYACPCDESTMFDRFLLPNRASGMWVWVEDDEEPYLDLVMGYSSLNFGHCHPEIVQFVNVAADRLSQIHSFHTVEKLRLSKYLVDAIDPEGGYQVYFDVGGSSVVASAMRLCRSYTNRKTVVSFEGAFHGAGGQPSTASDHSLLNEEQYGLGDRSSYIEKLPFPSRHGNVSVDQCMQMLEELIARDKPAAVIVEPIQGAAGFIIPPDDFLPRLREVTESAGIMLIADEIQMGMGRTGYLYSFQHWGITPDIVLVSKSLSGGYYPLSAIIAKSPLFETVSHFGTAFQSTFNNNPFGIQIALQIMEMIDRENLFENARVQGSKLLEQLRFIEDSPFTANLRGHGLAIAFDFVDSGSSGMSAPELARRFANIALDEHVLVYACGVDRGTIKFAPMITIDDDDISIIARKLLRLFLNVQRFTSIMKNVNFDEKPILADVTIRDGGYLNDWNFPMETIRTIVRYLDRFGMDIIEVGYLSDDESKPPAARCSANYLEILREDISSASIAGMLNVKKHANPLGVLSSRKGLIDLVRIPTFVEDVDSVIQFVSSANELGIRCSVNLISFTSYSDSELLGAVEKIAASGQVEMLYFADSRGSVYPETLFNFVSDVRRIWKAPLGFHAHDNLGLAIENSKAALDAGCNLIDCSINGYGLGGRNTEFVQAIDLVRDFRPNLPAVEMHELETIVEAIGMPPKDVFHDMYYQSGLKNLEQEWCPILWDTYGDRCFELLEKLPRRKYKEIDEIMEFADTAGCER